MDTVMNKQLDRQIERELEKSDQELHKKFQELDNKLDEELDKKSVKKSDKRFRLRTKRFFLTYPKLPMDIDLIECALSHYENVFKKKRHEFKCTITRELHEDGTPHLHVYLEFDEPQAIYSATKLDLKINNGTFHGNYQSAKTQHGSLQYILKAKDEEVPEHFYTNMELPIVQGKYYSNVHEHLYAVMLEHGEREAVKLLYEQYPKDAIQKGSILLRNLELAQDYQNLEKGIKPRFSLEDFNELSDDLRKWLEDEKPLHSLLIYGKSGTGKTELAKVLMEAKGIRYLFVRDIQGLKDFHSSIQKGIIFDDLNLREMERETLIALFDVENSSDIRILYKSVKIPAETLRIFTTNRPQDYLKEEALNRRILSVKADKQLFLPTPSSDEEIAGVSNLESSKDDNLSIWNNMLEGSIVANKTPLEKVKNEVIPDIPSTVNVDSVTEKVKTTDVIEKVKDVVEEPVKKKRGRPKGSKNKPKNKDTKKSVVKNPKK